jgi:predicted TIM-barrel fold metal-dependent hydrolase
VTIEAVAEAILEPSLEIVDAHHHLWHVPDSAIDAMDGQDDFMARTFASILRRVPRYLFDELVTDLTCGHNLRATVFVEAHAMYRTAGRKELRSVGEIEFANGVAAMGASGLFGDIRPCAAIVGGVDLSLGDAAEEVLLAHVQAGGGRYRGVRSPVVYDPDPQMLGGRGRPQALLDDEFRRGFRLLERFGLSFDAFVLEPQLSDVVELARSFPNTQIVVNHVGGLVGAAAYAGQRVGRFGRWRAQIDALAGLDNVAMKLGGFGTAFAGFDSYLADPPAGSLQLADEWTPYFEACVEAFGVERCMFESNFPPDSTTASYAVLWNAFKRLAGQCSTAEKEALFSGTAIRVYRMDLEMRQPDRRSPTPRPASVVAGLT